ncbi:protein-export membrane protein SecD [Candidatus Epulonipiscium fishelsonii]|uniref:Protein-export membrane protein SecD n=1 Tax=Candidatus Epulonipiscium fishelsonii TaxID=77094 RepID=A0ACC8XJL9_9FIRM|nr:protein-export membrane protein SecD [Epulopiscium sp. SCG-D08WGA-EpuloA1]OON94335.1 MAG: protein-export membrane protein SecD [Epulopiscium sp. AS2M-Bin002]
MKNILYLVGLIAIIVASPFIAYYGLGENDVLGFSHIKLGLDLNGGVSIVYEAQVEEPLPEEMSSAVQMIQARLDSQNYTEAEVAIEGINRIRVNIPGVDDPLKAIEDIGATALLTFEDEDGNIVLEGKNIKKASPQVTQTQFGQEAIVSLEFDNEGKDIFADVTKNNIGKAIIIKLDGEIISAPVVNEEIRGGTCMISGTFTPDSAKSLAELISAGALPFALESVSSTSVGAKLGMDAFNSSLKAGIYGFSIILIFMLCVYRINGLAGNLALTLYVSMLIMFLSWTSSTLTLPGIAGIILSIGMAVDANVIIFTRIKEELNQDNSLKFAINDGFSKAVSGIVDGNVTTLITSGVLYLLGTGLIKSFALTLGTGIILSMFTALVITKRLLKLFYAVGIQSPVLYGAKKAVK